MCLNTTFRKQTSESYNKTKIRWKVLYKDSCGGLQSEIFHHIWVKGKRYKSKRAYGGKESQRGFHVFVHKKDALIYLKHKACKEFYRVVELEVKGFRRSGHYGIYESEIWNQAKITKVLRCV